MILGVCQIFRNNSELCSLEACGNFGICDATLQLSIYFENSTVNKLRAMLSLHTRL